MLRIWSLLGLLLFLALVGLLHVLEPQYSPVTSTISEYVLGAYSYVMIAAFLALASGSGTLALAIRHTRLLGPLGMACLWIWSCGTLIAGIFPTDVGGEPATWYAVVHALAATSALLSLCIAELNGLRRAVVVMKTPPLAISTLIVCLFIAIAFLLGGMGILPFGLVERIVVTSHIFWLATLALLAPGHVTRNAAK